MGNFANLLAKLNAKAMARANHLSNVNAIMRRRNFPPLLQRRVRLYYDAHVDNVRDLNVDHRILAELSPSLRVDVCLHVFKDWIDAIDLLKTKLPPNRPLPPDAPDADAVLKERAENLAFISSFFMYVNPVEVTPQPPPQIDPPPPVRKYNRGDVIFALDDVCTSMIFLIKGAVRLFANSPTPVAELRQGDVLGLVTPPPPALTAQISCMLGGHRRTMTAKCAEPTAALIVDVGGLAKLLAAFPRVREELRRAALGRLRAVRSTMVRRRFRRAVHIQMFLGRIMKKCGGGGGMTPQTRRGWRRRRAGGGGDACGCGAGEFVPGAGAAADGRAGAGRQVGGVDAQAPPGVAEVVVERLGAEPLRARADVGVRPVRVRDDRRHAGDGHEGPGPVRGGVERVQRCGPAED
jgi:hypothetical protein